MPEVILSGPEGRLEGRYFRSDNPGAPVALVLHPHPRHGGTMNNKVVYNLFQGFARQGFSVLRINFRGVGKSQGKFDNGIGELSDAATALDWLQMENENARSFWISGFSFGAWIALQLLMRRPELEGFVAVSPPVNMYDFSFLAPCPSSGIFLQGDQDSIVPEDHVTKFHSKLKTQPNIQVDYRIIRGGDHFFRNTMDELNGFVDTYVTERLQNATMQGSSQRPDKKRRLPPVV
ncbi:MAG: alpha/beta hydrolase [Rickettsiales bacterium]|nr:alpha/beta hydrolase [Rickettsiales bacterium]